MWDCAYDGTREGDDIGYSTLLVSDIQTLTSFQTSCRREVPSMNSEYFMQRCISLLVAFHVPSLILMSAPSLK